MRKIFLLIGALLLSSPAVADWTGKDASNATITFKNANTCSSVVCVPIAQPVDSTGAAFGVTANPMFVAPGTGQTFPVSAASLPLPAGAATQTTLASILTALGSPFQAGGSIGNTSFASTQSGTWNITNVSGTVSLPTGASISANQPTNAAIASTTSGQTGNLHMGAVTTAAPTYTTGQTDPLSLTTAGALRVDASGSTQPISGTVTASQATAANLNATVVGTGTFATQLTGATNNINNIAGTISLPTGASTSAKQPALGTAGSASTDVLTVQGIASMTPFLTNPGTAANWGIGTSTQNSATVANGHLMLGQFNTTPTTITTGNMSPLQLDSAGNVLVNVKAGGAGGGAVFGPTAVGSANANPPVVIGGTATGAAGQNVEGVAVKPASTAPVATDLSLVTTKSPNSPDVPFAAYSTASITRPANTTTYTANTGWCTLTSSCVTFFSFTSACRVNGGQVLIPRIDIWSSANPTLKLTGVLYIFSAVPGTNISDDATFTIASADFANLTGNFSGFPFALGNNQATAASNSSVSLIGTTYQAQCASGSTTITGMVEVSNAYVPASAEVLHIGLATVGAN